MNLSDDTLKAYRAGFNTMWKHAASYMRRRRIPRAGEFEKTNVHGGRLWGTRKECKLSDKMAGEIIERVYLSKKVGLDQLKQVRHSMSYAHYLRTGVGGKNFPEVKAQWRSFKLSGLPGVKRPVKATRIPTPVNLKKAFTRQWSIESELNLPTHMMGVQTTYDTHVFGLRPNVDIKKVKDSRIHEINMNDGYGRTQMVEGRSKLHLHKRGTRPWWCYRVCLCKNKHKTPTSRQMRLNKKGNPKSRPTWNTCCPVAAMQFLEHHQGSSWRSYPKWNKTGNYGDVNEGDVASFANQWLNVQGQHADAQGTIFDRNSGRKSLARWLEELGVPYRESLHIHGDLEDVWRHAYQGGLSKSHYRVREQSTDPDTATKALRRFKKWLHGKGNGPSLKEKLQEILDRL